MSVVCMCFFFNDTATTEIYTYLHTLSLHDALPICRMAAQVDGLRGRQQLAAAQVVVEEEAEADHPGRPQPLVVGQNRSEEHTSELQSLMRISYAVFCLTNKKKNNTRLQTQQT